MGPTICPPSNSALASSIGCVHEFAKRCRSSYPETFAHRIRCFDINISTYMSHRQAGCVSQTCKCNIPQQLVNVMLSLFEWSSFHQVTYLVYKRGSFMYMLLPLNRSNSDHIAFICGCSITWKIGHPLEQHLNNLMLQLLPNLVHLHIHEETFRFLIYSELVKQYHGSSKSQYPRDEATYQNTISYHIYRVYVLLRP